MTPEESILQSIRDARYKKQEDREAAEQEYRRLIWLEVSDERWDAQKLLSLGERLGLTEEDVEQDSRRLFEIRRQMARWARLPQAKKDASDASRALEDAQKRLEQAKAEVERRHDDLMRMSGRVTDSKEGGENMEKIVQSYPRLRPPPQEHKAAEGGKPRTGGGNKVEQRDTKPGRGQA